MICELLSLKDLDATFLDEWAALAAGAIEPNPFFEAPFLLPALAHLDPGHRVRLLVVRDGTQTVMLLPVVHQPWWKHLPIDALVGWRHDQCFLGTPLARGDALSSAAALLSEQMERRRLGARLLALSWAALDGPVTTALTSAWGQAVPLTLDSFERPVLHRQPHAGYEEALGHETRRRLARRGRALERELGGVKVVHHAGEPAAYERFLHLEASGWKGETRTALMADPGRAAFFTDMATRLAALDRLELRALETADGTTLAMSARLLACDGVFCFKVAFDERFRKYAPGLQLEIMTLSEFQDRDREQWVDACTAPGNEFFEALFPGRRRIANVLLPAGGAINARIIGALPRLRNWQRRLRGGV